MRNKLKVLWFGLIPLGWFLSFILVKWIQFYPVSCPSDGTNIGICLFLGMSGIFGTLFFMFGSLSLAIYLQD